MTWDDLDDLTALDADPEVMRFLGAPRTRAEVVELMPGRLSPSEDAIGLGFWCGIEAGAEVEPRDRGRFAGWWCLSLDGPGLAELGYRLHRHAWGRGLAVEGSAALLEHGFATVGLERIIATTMTVNAGSRGVMRRLGMRHTATEVLTWADPLPDADQGEVSYEITRAEWAAAR